MRHTLCPRPFLAPVIVAAALVHGCAAPSDEPMANSERLAELEAQDALEATEAELARARIYLAGWVEALGLPYENAESDWLRRAGRPPEGKAIAALIDRRDPALGGAGGLPGLYLARLADGARPTDQLQVDRIEPALFALLRDDRARWRTYGCETLAHMESDRADRALEPLLRDPEPQVRLAAASALAQRGDPVGLPLLLAAADEWAADGGRGTLPYRHHFTRYANADFGDDLRAYADWFERYPVWER